MKAKDINAHLATYKGTRFTIDDLNNDRLSYQEKLAIKNTIMCSAWAYAGPAIMFVFRSLLVKKLKPGWAVAAEALNIAFNAACDIPQQQSSS